MLFEVPNEKLQLGIHPPEGEQGFLQNSVSRAPKDVLGPGVVPRALCQPLELLQSLEGFAQAQPHFSAFHPYRVFHREIGFVRSHDPIQFFYPNLSGLEIGQNPTMARNENRRFLTEMEMGFRYF